jgi:hypothetical protein
MERSKLEAVVVVKDFIFNKYDKNILRRIEDYLEYIDPMPEAIFKNSELFKQDSLIYNDKNKLLRHVDEGILYQENQPHNTLQIMFIKTSPREH